MEVHRELNGSFGVITKENVNRASEYIVLTGDDDVDYASIIALENLRILVSKSISNDKLKYAIPECWKVDLTSTWNIRSLMNLFELRTDKSALWEFRQLGNAMFDALPEDYKFLLKDYVKEEVK